MGRSVLVTGGSRGIGKATALRFAREGATRIAIGYMRSDAAAEETAGELQALGAEPVLVRGNVTSERVLQQVSELGPIDVFVHNVATAATRSGPRDGGEALGLDAQRERPLRSSPSPERSRRRCRPARRWWRSRASARSACSRTTPSSAPRRRRSSRSARYLAVELGPGGGFVSMRCRVEQYVLVMPARHYVLLNAARIGLGVALQSRVAVQLELDLGRLEAIRPRGGLPERSWFVVWSSAGPAREAVEAFAEYAQSAAARRALAAG